ncbi:MAG: hypothetical protein ACI93T_004092, partial [Porticoccaceae bacterium]
NEESRVRETTSMSVRKRVRSLSPIIHAFVEMVFGHFVSSVGGGIWRGGVVDADDRAGTPASFRFGLLKKLDE